ncbi:MULTISPECIES: hypothetical protein [Pseudomonas]|uniref:Uncharacterized protein n=1 Tax=Pseudomonas aphyarum TaxID=2942629 RepID=A0ABT5PLX4_9PSED|nr:hypothetical protein [Pseudomonas aphyarum]MDD0968602.1 hypothetical protein [Pseudomonas aphyarum]MDD1124502.1 hypothetical protein [Pseudomonas aphyarum]
MNLTGHLLIGAADVPATEGTMKALNPATNSLIEPEFAFGGAEQVDGPAALLPEALRDGNRLQLPRLVDGQ